MAIRFTNSTSVGIAVDANNDTWITRQDRYVASDTDAFDFGTFNNVEYFLQGDVFAGDDGVVASSGAFGLNVIVGLGASINAAGDGIQFLGNTGTDTSHRVTNDGSIVGEAGEGVDIRAQQSQVANNGFISGAGFGIFMSGDNNSVFNTGSVIANSNGIGMSGNSGELFNTGSVISGFDGLEVTGNNSQLVNTGSVIAGAAGLSMNGTGTITNSGSVTADNDGVRISLSEGEIATFVNSGTVTVLSQSTTDFAFDGSLGEETVINTGLLQGAVWLDSGNDRYIGKDGTVTGLVGGGDGNDRLIGGDEDNEFEGGFGNDVLRGKDGDDDLSGDGGTDTLRGNKGDDTLKGGGAADDLHGGQGDDILRGNGGPDTLAGGRGDDTLSGGDGTDVYIFRRAADDDIITDFDNGTDLIDVSAFGLGGFSDLAPARTTVGGDTVIDWSVVGGQGQLIIEGISGGIGGADFIF